jgi:hypothetical protein
MRILTLQEVEHEIQAITTRTWPLDPTLPMKNLYRVPPTIGYILRKEDIIEPIVRTHDGQLLPYESLKAMIEDGWVVD